MVRYYRKAHELRQKARGEELWLQGLYIYEALCDVSPVLHAFAKKGTKVLPYPDQPFPRTNAELKERRVLDEQIQMNKMKAKFTGWVAGVNVRKAKMSEKVVKSDE